MGKKRTVNKAERQDSTGKASRARLHLPKRRISEGIVNIEATHNNTRVLFCEKNGNVVMWTSSGVLGFNAAKKSTPYAASKVADAIAEKAQAIGVKDIDIIVKGVGSGRESALRSFVNRGFAVNSITDKTPIAFNGPRKRKPRRV